MTIKNFIVLFFCFLSFSFTRIHYFNLPTYFPSPVYKLDKNQITEEKIELGRALFYDPILSKDNTISCASCHSPYNAFAHTDHALSHGINNQIGTRNAPALFNLAWQKSFMWDGAINHLDVQALAPISHPKEMGEDIKHVCEKLQNKPFYKSKFYRAFNDTSITGERTLLALAQFQLTLISANAKYDKVKKGIEEFTAQEEKGYHLFLTNCNSCHAEPLFSNYSFANNGLSVDTTLNDFGKWMITRKTEDSLLFKIPSLRNLSYTYPYMHDGRFKKLNEVLNHYTSEISNQKDIDEKLKKPIELSANDKIDLITFLYTLNDKEFVFNPKHQFPKEILNSAKEK